MPSGDHGHPVIAGMYDAVLWAPERLLGLSGLRRRTLTRARGRVLEIGFGTGLNTTRYPDIDELVAVEPDPAMRARAHRRLTRTSATFDWHLVDARAEALPFAAATFDTAVVCLSMCTVGDPSRATRELHRVLRGDGELLFLEHIRAANPAVRWLQHAATPAWRAVAGGCHLDRTTLATFEQHGFVVSEVSRSAGGRGSLARGVARPRRG